MRDSSRSCFSSFLLPARSGHSERRGEFGLPTPAESNELLATKCAYALEKGLKVVFAIGEPLPIREKGVDAVLAECIKQLEGVKGLLDPAKVVIAYEPVWAIGTGKTATPEAAQEIHAFIRKWVSENVSAEAGETTRIQYGGSAKPGNAADLAAQPDIDGLLIGSAALNAGFIDCINAFKVKL
jgi:triosephosphate isomerase